VLDDAAARDILRAVAARPEVASPVDAFPGILGYRGVIVEVEHEGAKRAAELAHGVPAAFRLGSGRAQDNARSFELAERLVEQMRDPVPTAGREDSGPGYEEMKLGARVLEWIAQAASSAEFLRSPWAEESNGALEDASPEKELGQPTGHASTTDQAVDAELKAKAACWNPAPVLGTDASSWFSQTVGSCGIEVANFNPAFWNNPSVQPYNNCYNYATNRRTDTFAQPGRATCAGTSIMQCPNVSAGASSDGAFPAPTCASASDAPRWYMALVVAPGIDYHWYRLAAQGYWGHKPGSTAAKNTDNSGNVIYNPQTCNRGIYTSWCGYWFARRSMGIR
jgi:hypothetical protein